MRGLYNFGWRPDQEEVTEAVMPLDESKRIDEEEAMEGGLRGRFSAGGEVYFSAKQRSFGGKSQFPQSFQARQVVDNQYLPG